LDWHRFLRRRDLRGGRFQRVEGQRNVTADTFKPALRGDCELVPVSGKSRILVLAGDITATMCEVVSNVIARTCISFTKSPFNAPAFQCSVKKEEGEWIVKSLQSKIGAAPFNLVTQDLLDLEYIQTHYRTSIGDFVSVLGRAAYLTNVLRVEPWFGSSIAITRAR
jgi:hypothetical protein